jgi:hypothetical protein
MKILQENKEAVGIPIFRPLLLAFLLLALPIGLKAETGKRIGMWVWSESSFSTQEARQRLIQFCLKHDIRHLDVYTRISQDPDQPTLPDAEALRDLIFAAGQHHITIAGLRGHPRMFFPENQEQTLRELRALIAFSRTLPEDALFKGIKYDVEPYCTKEWKTDQSAHQAIMRDYLSFLRRARSLLREEASRLSLAVDTPFWWDKDEYLLEFGGKIKRFSEHIQDLTDYIVIMSYRRNTRMVLNCVDDERMYARRIHKVIFPSLETVRLKQDPEISFWGLPQGQVWDTASQLLEEASKDPAMGGVMIHCYRSLSEKLDEDTPDRTGAITPE